MTTDRRADDQEPSETVAELEQELAVLRGRLPEAAKRIRTLEERLLEAKGKLAQAAAQNERLATTLSDARDHIAGLRDEVEKLTQPPHSYGTVVGVNDDDETIDVRSAGRKLRVSVHPECVDRIEVGHEVALNEASSVVLARTGERNGEVVSVVDVLADERRVIVAARADESRVCALAEHIDESVLRSGDAVLMDPQSGMVIEYLPQSEVEDLLLEEVPDVSYSDIGGLDEQIEKIIETFELPYLHPELFAKFRLSPPKGVLLFGPPGCGKTMIAKAVANSLARRAAERGDQGNAKSYFINIKGPELLNKYVGETERHIRRIFERARQKASEGFPVVIFFDEMEAMFRVRGSGISSDVNSTIVPQLLAEIDGVEQLSNVIVIGASNREDLIDPAILRPGRLDVKIRINRPGAPEAESIFGRYLDTSIPLDPTEVESLGGGDEHKTVLAMIEQTVEEMYTENDRNAFLEVQYERGDRQVLYFKDFASGAMIEHIVRRAKKNAVKRSLAGDRLGLRLEDLTTAIRAEFGENEELPNAGNSDDWAKIQGQRGDRITFIRTLIDEGEAGGRSVEKVQTGQYL